MVFGIVDFLGWRKEFLFVVFLYSVGVLVIGFVLNFVVVVVGRLIFGFGIGFFMYVVFMYIVEIFLS